MNAIVIRPYEPGDWNKIEEIHDLARQEELALAGLAPAFVPLKTAAEREGLFDYTLRVAVTDGTVRGFAAYTEEELAWLYIDPRWKRRGLGRALVRYVLENVKNRPLAVEVLAGNIPALALYEQAGFRTQEVATGHMPGNEEFAVTVHCMELA